MNNKIISEEKIKEVVKTLKRKKKKIILCHGAFDLVHLGHVKHFESAKNKGDILIVSITADKFIHKGPGRPKFNENQRMEYLSKLEMIDFIVLSNEITAISVIKKIRPNIYCKGPDYKNDNDDVTGNIKKERLAVKSINGKIEYTDDQTFSSSNLLNKSGNLNNNLFKKLRKKINIQDTLNKFDLLKNKKVLVLGEIIVDEYQFCEAIGKSGKEPVLVMHDKFTEKYIGGVGAIANHVSSFCNDVTIMSFIGDHNTQKSFIKRSLNNKVKTILFNKSDSPTINKKRYIDEVNQNKILGVYTINDEDLNKKDEKKFLEKLKKSIKNYDIVILTDYGHGIITPKIANFVCKNSNYLSVNSQINASNIGYQNLNKYNNFDFLILNEGEIRHDARDRTTPINALGSSLIAKLKSKKAIITSGKDGAQMIFNNKSKIEISCPGFAEKIVDKIGSGDAMLSLASLCDYINMSDQATILISSLAAAQAVETMGNKEFVSELRLKKAFYYTLK